MSQLQKVEISVMSYLKLLLVVVGSLVLWQIRAVVVLLFVVFILVQALRPVISWLMRRGIPRVGSLVLVYVALAAAGTAILSLVVPPLVDQLQLLAINVPILIERFRPLYDSLPTSVNLQQFVTTITAQLAGVTGNVFALLSQVFGGVLSLFTVLVLSFYLLADERQLTELIHLVVPNRLTGAVRAVLEKIGARVGGWVRGQALVSFIIGVVTLVVFSVIGVPYALTLAVIAGILEILPIIGPIIAAAIALVIALGSGSWGLALATVVASALIQQLENNFVVPKVMEKAVGLSPAVVIVALLVGGALAGVPGAVLAVPVAAGIDVLVDEWGNLRAAFEGGKLSEVV